MTPSNRANRASWTGRHATLSAARFAGVALVAGAMAAACVSSSSNDNAGPDAGIHADASFPDSGGNGDASPVDANGFGEASPPDSAVPGDAAPPDSAVADPFQGVWQGLQTGATVEISNAAGCSIFKDSVGGVTCDECVGNYVAGDAGSAAVVVKCRPLGACSVSPVHTDTGTFTFVDGGALLFAYDFGGGASSVETQLTPRAPGDVCGIIDAGGD
jgi:hypothetical protein